MFNIGDLFRDVFQVRRCPTPAAFLSYMRHRNIYQLNNWVNWRNEYKRDTLPSHRWRSIDKILADDVPGVGMFNDCEEQSILKKFVTNVLGWATSRNLVTQCMNITKNHAVCLSKRQDDIVLMDYTIKIFPANTSVRKIVREMYPEAQTFCFCDDAGHDISGKVPVS